MGSVDVDWAALPDDDIMRRIVEDHIISVDDYVMFSCVCQSWYSVACGCDKSKLRTNWRRQMPWLMLTDGNNSNVDAHYGFIHEFKGRRYMFGENVVHRFNDRNYDKNIKLEAVVDRFPHLCSDEDEDDANNVERQRDVLNLSNGGIKCYTIALPELYGRACWGSRYGWIVTLGRDREMFMFNPLTRATLHLPSAWTFPFPWMRANGKTIRNKFIDRAVLVWVPRDPNTSQGRSICYCARDDDGIWLVVALHHYNRLVAIAKPGDSSWAPIHKPSRHHACYPLMDVVYCVGLRSLLFVDTKGNIYVSDLHDIESPQVLKRFLKAPRKLIISHGEPQPRTYIIESEGDNVLIILRFKVLRVARWNDINHNLYVFTPEDDDYGEIESHLTVYFRIYKLDIVAKRFKELRDLGDVSLFVGNNDAISARSTDFGCQGNSIYFCDDYRTIYGRPKIGFGGHDMGVFKMDDKTIQPFYDGRNSNSIYCCPVWFCPPIL